MPARLGEQFLLWGCLGLIAAEFAVAADPKRPDDAARLVVVAGTPLPGQPPVAGELREPFAVDADRQGNLYVCELEGRRVHMLDREGRLSTIAGTGEEGSAGDGGPAIKAQFNGMHHLAVMANGDLLVADTWNNRVRRIDPVTGRITAFVGVGSEGFGGDGGPAGEALCGGIYCLALDSAGERLFLADLDNRRIRVVTLADGRIDTYAGNGDKGVPTDGSLAKKSPLVDPRAVACDSRGNVYVLERSGHALRVIDADGRIRTVAGTGEPGPAADDVPALEATFNGPKHLCIDRQDNVIIADTENHVIRRFLVQEGRVVRVAGSGEIGAAGLDGAPTAAQLSRPHGVFVDTRGTLYIVDSGNHRLLRLDEGAQ